MRLGIAHDYSNADGGWISALITTIGGLGEAGFQYGAAKDASNAAITQTQLQTKADTTQVLYGTAGNTTANQMLAAALTSKYANQQQQPSSINPAYIIFGLVAIGAIVALVVVLKSD